MKQLKNKLLLLAMAVVLTLGTLNGCSQEEDKTPDTVRVGSLKGPTSLGILPMMREEGYSFTMAVGADELLPLMMKGEMDIALVPANVAAILYQKSNQAVAVVDINTLGVLSIVTAREAITAIADLEGKTITLTGKGTTPEAALRYLLEKNGILESCTLEFKSEATEVAAVLANDSEAIGLLPQPFVTAACSQNSDLKIVMDLNEEWKKWNEAGDGMVTGVTVVRKEFLEQYPEAVNAFIQAHKDSVNTVNENPEDAAKLAVEAGIVAAQPIAQKAIPYCNLVCIDGLRMKEALKSYLSVLYDFEPSLVGGSLPEDNFYN